MTNPSSAPILSDFDRMFEEQFPIASILSLSDALELAKLQEAANTGKHPEDRDAQQLVEGAGDRPQLPATYPKGKVA